MIVDAEKLVSKHLRELPALVDLGVRVVGKTPGDTTEPWIRVTQLDATQQDRADRLVPFYLQFDCYAGKTGGQPEATLIGRTVREALTEIPNSHSDGTVSGAQINGAARIPDTALEGARERVIVTATVYAHA